MPDFYNFNFNPEINNNFKIVLGLFQILSIIRMKIIIIYLIIDFHKTIKTEEINNTSKLIFLCIFCL
jgi:hypothetical protein